MKDNKELFEKLQVVLNDILGLTKYLNSAPQAADTPPSNQ